MNSDESSRLHLMPEHKGGFFSGVIWVNFIVGAELEGERDFKIWRFRSEGGVTNNADQLDLDDLTDSGRFDCKTGDG